MLREIHPGKLSSIAPTLAHYTGGMVDTGGLNWTYILFDAPIEALRSELAKFVKEAHK